LEQAARHAFDCHYNALFAAQNWQLGAGRLPVNHH